MLFARSRPSAAVLIAAGLAAPSFASVDEEGGDRGPHVVVGKTIGADSLTFGFEEADPDPVSGAVVIPIDTFEDPIPFTGVSGFRNIPFDLVQDLAFEAPGPDEADELAEFGFDAVPTSSSIALEAVALPADFSIFLQGQALLQQVGQTLTLGSPEFDLHPLYVLETPGAALLGRSTTGSFRFIDTTGALAPSGTFEVTLQVVPEPSTAMLGLGLGGGVALLRRRRAAG